MDHDRAQQVTLFRYSLIRELTDAELTPRERGALITTIADSDPCGPARWPGEGFGAHVATLVAGVASGRVRRFGAPGAAAAQPHPTGGAGRRVHPQASIVAEMLARIDQAEATIARLSDQIDVVIAPFAHQRDLLCTIPGVDRRTAEVIIAEIGVDMSRFPTAGHLASWAGMCPGNNESAGKHQSGKTRKGSKWLRKALIEAPTPPPGPRASTCRPTTTASAGAGTQEGGDGGGPLDPGDRLPPAGA